MPTQEYNELMAAQKADKALPGFMNLVEEAFDQKHGASRIISKKTSSGVTTYIIKQVKDYLKTNIQNIQAIVSMRSPYALHAVLYILGGIRIETFLKTFSDQEIKGFDTLISKVKDYPEPNAEKTDQCVSDNMPNNVMRKKTAEMQVALIVYWSEVHATVEKWYGVLQDFYKKKEYQAMIEKEVLWTFDRLYQAFAKHYKNKKTLLQIKCHALSKLSEEERAEVDSWFPMSTNPKTGKKEKMFRALYLDKFAALLGVELDVETLEQVGMEKPIVQSADMDIVESTGTMETVSTDGMVGVKALQTLVEKLIGLRDAAQQSAERATAQFNEAWANVRAATTSAERAKLLAEATDANTTIDKYAQQKDAHNADIRAAEALLTQRAELEQLLADKDAEIAIFTKQIQEKIK